MKQKRENQIDEYAFRKALAAVWKWSNAYQGLKDKTDVDEEILSDLSFLEQFMIACYSELQLCKKDNLEFKQYQKWLNNYMGVN